MELPAPGLLAVLFGVPVVLIGVHLVATGGTGQLGDAATSNLAITPGTTLSRWWRHLWAGFFHKSWGHLAFNLAIFALALPLAARHQPPWSAVANAYWIGPFIVFAMHLLLVLPLASAGLPYAVRALDVPLVGFSVIAYSLAGIALVGISTVPALSIAAFVVLLEISGAIWVTSPFVSVYHLGGFGMGYWVRTILLRG